jgi:hypothetical protein
MTSNMPESGPTPRELHIMFSNIIDSLKDVKDTMATKEFVNIKFDSYNDRIAGDQNLNVEIDKSVKVVADRIDQLEADLKEQEKVIKAQRNGRAQAITFAILGAILSVVGSVVASGVIRGLFPVS